MSFLRRLLALQALIFVVATLVLFTSALKPVEAQSRRQVLVLTFEGPVTPAMLTY